LASCCPSRQYLLFFECNCLRRGRHSFPTRRSSDLDANPVLSMIYLLIVLVGWTVVFILGVRWAFRRTIGLRKQVNKLLSEGTLVHGKVARVVSVKSTAEGFEEKELIVHFNNFRKQPVSYPIVLMDRRPEQRRYEKGKPIQLRIDDTLKISPYIV